MALIFIHGCRFIMQPYYDLFLFNLNKKAKFKTKDIPRNIPVKKAMMELELNRRELIKKPTNPINSEI